MSVESADEDVCLVPIPGYSVSAVIVGDGRFNSFKCKSSILKS